MKGFTASLIAELRHEGSSARIGLVTVPGVNTPHVTWNLNKMAGHPMPVPPLSQPAVATKAIVAQEQHPRRNVWVGIPTALTALGNRLAPGFVDCYLERTGIDSPHNDQNAARLGSNVFQPQDETSDRGARGAYDDRAHTVDPVSSLSSTVGRTVGSLGHGLAGVHAVLDRRA